MTATVNKLTVTITKTDLIM